MVMIDHYEENNSITLARIMVMIDHYEENTSINSAWVMVMIDPYVERAHTHLEKWFKYNISLGKSEKCERFKRYDIYGVIDSLRSIRLEKSSWSF